ncbi:YciI family protein [Actinomadura sp.]|uniref:YciI family protein n=1 Tax=Actinomadura sp. TaxID=1989 RepID=UPI0037C539EC
MQYALLIYGGDPDAPPDRPMDEAVAAVLARPYVTGWARLHAAGSATTVRAGEAGMLLTDGPFVDSKEFLAGLVMIEADDLDGALAVAAELQETREGGAIEVRPLREGYPRGA